MYSAGCLEFFWGLSRSLFYYYYFFLFFSDKNIKWNFKNSCSTYLQPKSKIQKQVKVVSNRMDQGRNFF